MHNVNVDGESPRRWLLAIDTSSERLGVAVGDGEQVAELTWVAGRQQSTVLLPAIDAILGRVGIGVADLGAVAVAVGPGTFNGLRAGLGTAKGIALGAGLAMIGVGTLAATVLPSLAPGRLTFGVVAAGRGRVVAAGFRPDGDGWPVEVVPPVNGSIEELAVRLAGIAAGGDGLTVCGELTAAQETVVRSGLRQRDLWLLPPGARERRPGGVAALGARRWLAGDVDDPATLDAVYLHSAARPTVAGVV